MNPQILLFAIAMLACPIGMGLMMWMMNKNMGGQQQGHSMPGHTSGAERLKALRDQQRLLEQEIAKAETIAALEDMKATVAQSARRDSQAGPLESGHN